MDRRRSAGVTIEQSRWSSRPSAGRKRGREGTGSCSCSLLAAVAPRTLLGEILCLELRRCGDVCWEGVSEVGTVVEWRLETGPVAEDNMHRGLGGGIG